MHNRPCWATGEGTPPPQQMLAVGLLENCLVMLAGCAAGPHSGLGIVSFSNFPCVSLAWQSRAWENAEHPHYDPRAFSSNRGCAASLPCLPLSLAHSSVAAEPGADTPDKHFFLCSSHLFLFSFFQNFLCFLLYQFHQHSYFLFSNI